MRQSWQNVSFKTCNTQNMSTYRIHASPKFLFSLPRLPSSAIIIEFNRRICQKPILCNSEARHVIFLVDKFKIKIAITLITYNKIFYEINETTIALLTFKCFIRWLVTPVLLLQLHITVKTCDVRLIFNTTHLFIVIQR